MSGATRPLDSHALISAQTLFFGNEAERRYREYIQVRNGANVDDEVTQGERRVSTRRLGSITQRRRD